MQLQALVTVDWCELLIRGLTNITSVSTVEDSGFTNLKKSERLLVVFKTINFPYCVVFLQWSVHVSSVLPHLIFL